MRSIAVTAGLAAASALVTVAGLLGAPALADAITGTPHADDLTGTSGADTINARAGADTVHARGGADLVRGGDGADRLFGQQGRDEIRGGKGPDMIDGGHGSGNGLIGEQGNDALYGRGTGLWSGGGGDDRLVIAYPGGARTHLHCGRGHDRVVTNEPLSAAADVRGCERIIVRSAG
jgi:Ca2+-binding RTX toxin-like protein